MGSPYDRPHPRDPQTGGSRNAARLFHKQPVKGTAAMRYDKENYRFVPRLDSVEHNGRWIVPTTYDTKWLEPADLNSVFFAFNEDQTEITLHAPEGTKFGIGFTEQLKNLLSCCNGQ
jgi:hypothetical protein